MAKTQGELNILKNEYESLNNKLKELTENELKKVVGGYHYDIPAGGGNPVSPDDSCPLCERCADCSWYRTNDKSRSFCFKPK